MCGGSGSGLDVGAYATISPLIAANLDANRMRFDVHAATVEGDRVAIEAESLKFGVRYNDYYLSSLWFVTVESPGCTNTTTRGINTLLR